MDAIILAGGRGKRLKPITDYVPKPLVPLNNSPILEWQIKFLKKFKINHIIICTGYKAEHIENFLKMKNNFGIKISLSIEKKPLGTGGAIKKASKLIHSDTFFVINGDTITNININKLKKFKNSIAAIELRTKYGILDVKNDLVTRFVEKKEVKDLWMNAGIYYMSKKILKDLPSIGDIEKTTFPLYAKKHQLHFVKFKNVIWHSIDSFKDMEESTFGLKQKTHAPVR